jgi:gas vesicle protein
MLLIFAAGALTGAAIALLYAPMSGTRLKRELRNNVEDVAEKIRENLEDKLDDVTRELKSAARKVGLA